MHTHNRHLIIILSGILILMALPCKTLFSQSRSDINLAREYLNEKEYKKAAALYERLYSQQPGSSVFFRYYIRSLLGTENYSKAERIAKRHIRKNPNDLRGPVMLGRVYQQQGEKKKAEKVYNKLIDNVSNNINRMRRLANIFISKRQFAWAEKVYLAGARKNKNYKFNYELANIYYYQRNYPKMIDTYLELLAQNDRYMNTVKNRLNSAVYTDTDDTLTDILKDRLLKMSQEYSGRDVFNQLLIWAYLQDKEYNNALVQAKALDRRNDEDGARVIKIARKALQSNHYGVVADATSYIMNKKRRTKYYIPARQLFLKSRFKQVQKGIVYQQNELKKLAGEYKKAISENKNNAEIFPFYNDIAKLYAFHMHKPDSALIYLNRARKLPHLSSLEQGKLDILKADIKLVKGKIFEATLIYAAVERKFKNNPLGYKAKLKKALMAFYQCDFEWSLGQLNILKASTSKLIANNAAELSLIISENKTEDTLQKPLCSYAKARMAIHQHHYDSALQRLDSLINGYPGQAIIDDALMSKAKLQKSMGAYKKAAELFLRVARDFSDEPYAAAANFYAAQLYEQQLGKAQKAFDLYKTVLTDYPMSIYHPTARKNLRAIRQKMVN